MILYLPKEEQRYYYYAKDKTEAYWVHFTGSNVKNFLKQHHIPLQQRVIYTGTSLEYQNLFKQMILELQTCRIGYEEMLVLHLSQLILMIERKLLERNPAISTFVQEEIEYARAYFTEHYNEIINIEEYAHSRSMSTSWFIRNFKQLTGNTPMQYILNIRINNAQLLLETTDYNVTEISEIIGYDNPLYFSRLYKKQKGVSPSEYRKTIRKQSYSP